MREWGGMNLWLTQRAIALGFVLNYPSNLGAIVARHKGRADSIFLS